MGIDKHFTSGFLGYRTMMPAAAWVFALYNHFGSHPPVPLRMSVTLPYLCAILTVDHSFGAETYVPGERNSAYSRIPTLVSVIYWLAAREINFDRQPVKKKKGKEKERDADAPLIESEDQAVFRLVPSMEYLKFIDYKENRDRKGHLQVPPFNPDDEGASFASNWTECFSPRFELHSSLKGLKVGEDRNLSVPSSFSSASMDSKLVDLVFRMLYDWPFRTAEDDPEAYAVLQRMDRSLRYFNYESNVVEACTKSKNYVVQTLTKHDPADMLKLKKKVDTVTQNTDGRNALDIFAPWLFVNPSKEDSGEKDSDHEQVEKPIHLIAKVDITSKDGKTFPKFNVKKNRAEAKSNAKQFASIVDQRAQMYLEKAVRLSTLAAIARGRKNPPSYPMVKSTFNSTPRPLWSGLSEDLSRQVRVIVGKRLNKMRSLNCGAPFPTPQDVGDDATKAEKKKAKADHTKEVREYNKYLPYRVAFNSRTEWNNKLSFDETVEGEVGESEGGQGGVSGSQGSGEGEDQEQEGEDQESEQEDQEQEGEDQESEQEDQEAEEEPNLDGKESSTESEDDDVIDPNYRHSMLSSEEEKEEDVEALQGDKFAATKSAYRGQGHQDTAKLSQGDKPAARKPAGRKREYQETPQSSQPAARKPAGRKREHPETPQSSQPVARKPAVRKREHQETPQSSHTDAKSSKRLKSQSSDTPVSRQAEKLPTQYGKQKVTKPKIISNASPNTRSNKG